MTEPVHAARRYVTHVPLRWADMDSLRHVNNVVYLRYLQEARVDMLFVQAARQGAGELAAGVVVNRHEIEYLSPLRFQGRPVRVETWVRDVRNATFTLGYEICDADDSQHVYARATTVLVPYDLADGRPRRTSAQERAVLESYLDTAGARPTVAAGGLPGGEEPANTYVYRCAVRFDDLDSYGHVNNVMLAEYLQEARIEFALEHLAGVLRPSEGSVVVSQVIDYLAPIPSRSEPLCVHVWVTRLGTSSFDVAYEVGDDERTYARATTGMVAYNLEARASRPLRPEELDAMKVFS